jgi:hypothetical protein
MSTDPLISQLREEAARFDPAPPPAVRRAVLAAIADLESTPAPRTRPAGTFARWPFAAALAVVTTAVVIVLVVRHRPATPTIVQTPEKSQWAAQTLHSTGTFSGSAHPIALARRWVQEPLQGEVNNLMTGLTEAGDTVTRALPGAVRHPGCAMPAPARRGDL